MATLLKSAKGFYRVGDPVKSQSDACTTETVDLLGGKWILFVRSYYYEGKWTVETLVMDDHGGAPLELQGHKEWLAEVQFLGAVEHPNLVKLLGYCSIDGERGIQSLLVYKYMPTKSLDDHLFSRALRSLPWKTRLQVLLHEGLEIQVIFRDLQVFKRVTG